MSLRGRQGIGQGVLWAATAAATILGLFEFARPGFLSIFSLEGALAAMVVLALAAAPGAALGLLVPMPVFRIWIVAVPIVLVAAAQLRGPDIPHGGLEDGRRVVFLGLDGATWDLIDPMVERGELPSFARLKDEGATGTLLSEEPTLSPRVWTTIASGVGPAGHGAMGFYSTQASIKVPRMWEIVEEEGGKVLLMRWLLTWPPIPSNGFVLPGWMARGPETWPPELSFLNTLASAGQADAGVLDLAGAAFTAYRNGLRLPTFLRAVRLGLWLKVAQPAPRSVEPIVDSIEGRIFTDVFGHLFRAWGPDFAALILYGTDALAHTYWQDFDPQSLGLEAAPDGGRFRDVIPDAYRTADRTLGRIMTAVKEDTTLVVVSDHGTGSGGLDTSRKVIRAEALLELLEMQDEVTAFSVGSWTFFQQDGFETLEVEPPIVSTLREATVAGEPLFSMAPSEPPFWQVSVAGEPPLDANVQLGDISVPLDGILEENKFTGSHRLEGIVALWGPGVVPGSRLEGGQLVDVAPTVLALLGCPLSDELEGRVLEEALEPGFVRNLRIATVPSYGEPRHAGVTDQAPEADEELKERLRALGYLQ